MLYSKTPSNEEQELVLQNNQVLPVNSIFLRAQDILPKLEGMKTVQIEVEDIRCMPVIKADVVSTDGLTEKEKEYLKLSEEQKKRIQEQFTELARNKKRVTDSHQEFSRQRSEFGWDYKKPIVYSHVPSDSHDILVPIRIDLEFEGIKYRDTFTWHLQEKNVTPEVFAEIICQDFDLPTSLFSPPISKSIREQIVDFSNYLKPDHESVNELRIIIKLDITIGTVSLIDQFEWDINHYNPATDPEEFALILSAELGLNGEFTTAIAHSIREQIYWHTKSLLIAGYNFDIENATVDDVELKDAFLLPVNHALRDEDIQDLFSPSLMEITDQDLEKLEQSRERDARRKRRLNRGRRVELWALRDPPKTNRTFPKKVFENLLELRSKESTYSVDPAKRRPYVQRGDIRNLIPFKSAYFDVNWRCKHCLCTLEQTPLLRFGPYGEKTLCNSCGLFYKNHYSLPPLQSQ
ncbi:SNF5/SMARCB1/INI1 domain-containing protein [Rozella allomycis CSF55]|uniref:SNF5/SMARCB1/INI1 domain-containing protein n=1 Tax=Rozella allomycis (strain CSF55) TaxID=988480 RepID=A0A075AQ10_ROZAC|nr:SNF5/SMARCB1/INI1 domain-containing protein [Rozella allomycis CSF55]|eukprot:EPZ32321.1 SNF5/SMARCB1/INI1 domain-containing protein [Rozella allomycis CSF55]